MKNAFELKRLGELYLDRGDYETAEMLLSAAINVEVSQAPISVALAEDLYNLGLLLSIIGKRNKDQHNLLKSWKIECSLLGAMHPTTLETFRTLTEIYQDEENTATPEVFNSSGRHSVRGSIMQH